MISCGSGTSSGARVLMTKNFNKFTAGKRFLIKYCNLLIPRPPGTGYRRSLQPSKENIQHFKTIKIIYFFSSFEGHFCPSWIHNKMRIRTLISADPDPQSWIKVERVFFQTTRDETILAVDRPDYSKTSYSFDDWGKF